MTLIILNYSMNPNSMVFSHQRRIVQSLATYFESIIVITCDAIVGEPIANVEVKSINWHEGQALRNMFRVLKVCLPILFRNRNAKIFSHMTDFLSFLLGPIAKILGMKHYLWYAHKSKSIYLQLSLPFLEAIVTSTRGSCPLNSSKVIAIGQSVDDELFKCTQDYKVKHPSSLYHVGRLDPSKNLELIIQSLDELRSSGIPLEITIYGAPSSKSKNEYAKNLISEFSKYPYNRWVKFYGSVPNNLLPEITKNHDVFIHAFVGSLDKSLVEACLLRKSVITANPEFLKAFSTYIPNESPQESLRRQLSATFDASTAELSQIIDRQFKIASREHTLRNWIDKLLDVLEVKHEKIRNK